MVNNIEKHTEKTYLKKYELALLESLRNFKNSICEGDKE